MTSIDFVAICTDLSNALSSLSSILTTSGNSANWFFSASRAARYCSTPIDPLSNCIRRLSRTSRASSP